MSTLPTPNLAILLCGGIMPKFVFNIIASLLMSSLMGMWALADEAKFEDEFGLIENEMDRAFVEEMKKQVRERCYSIRTNCKEDYESRECNRLLKVTPGCETLFGVSKINKSAKQQSGKGAGSAQEDVKISPPQGVFQLTQNPPNPSPLVSAVPSSRETNSSAAQMTQTVPLLLNGAISDVSSDRSLATSSPSPLSTGPEGIIQSTHH